MLHRDDRESVQAMECERREIGGRERLVAVFRRDPPERAEAIAARRRRGLPRHGHATRVADRHRLDTPRAIDQHADAAIQRAAGLGHLASQLMGDDVVRRDAAAVETLDAVLVGLREAEDVPVQL